MSDTFCAVVIFLTPVIFFFEILHLFFFCVCRIPPTFNVIVISVVIEIRYLHNLIFLCHTQEMVLAAVLCPICGYFLHCFARFYTLNSRYCALLEEKKELSNYSQQGRWIPNPVRSQLRIFRWLKGKYATQVSFKMTTKKL